MKKFILSLLLLIIMIITLFSVTMPVYAATNGNCGTNLSWTLDDNGTLTINGSGKMIDYSSSGSSRSPFCTNAANIKKVIINDDVTSIGTYAFYNCDKITSIEIGEGITSIGKNAFSYCTSLTQLN